jgi:hypothetical protein
MALSELARSSGALCKPGVTPGPAGSVDGGVIAGRTYFTTRFRIRPCL